MDKIKDLEKDIEKLEQQKWDALMKDKELNHKLDIAGKLYSKGLQDECEAVANYMDLLSCGCVSDALDEDDRKTILEIIADELNHIKKLQVIVKKYQSVKVATK